MSFVWRVLIVTFAVMAFSSRVEAVPLLQLDIVGGYYDTDTETIISDGPYFTLVALLTPRDPSQVNALLNDTYYVSAAVTPQLSTNTPLGTLTWNDTALSVTDDMVYGTPPIEGVDNATADAGDLGRHGVYPTYFTEFAFTFSPDMRTTTYNTADDPGGPTPSATGESYYQTFTVALDLPAAYQVHFDLYDTYLVNCLRNRTCSPDEDVDHFAPFSHDAQSGPLLNPRSGPDLSTPPVVPEPATLATMAVGLTLVGVRALRRRRSAVGSVVIGEN